MYSVNKQEVKKRLGVEEVPIIKTIEDIYHPHVLGPWVAGGSIRRIFSGEEQNSDIDYFFNNENQLKDFKEYLERKDSGAILRGSNDMNHSYVLPATKETVYDSETGNETPFTKFVPEQKIQLIHFRYYNNPQDVIDSFDYTLSQFLYDGESFHFGDFALFDVARKRLVPHKISYAASTLRRMLKYANQGYTICAGGLGEILGQVADNPSIINQGVQYID